MLLTNKYNKIRSQIISKRFKKCDSSVVFNTIGLIMGYEYITIGKNTVFCDNIFLTAWDKYYLDKEVLEIIDSLDLVLKDTKCGGG